jgi:hypothetical protein
MKHLKFALLAIIASSSSFCLAENSANYRYAGSTTSKEVCRAIVNDDVKGLQRALRLHRQTLVYAYSFRDLASRAIAGSFTCNGLELRDFSYNVGSQKALGFLSTGSGVVEEQVVFTGK